MRLGLLLDEIARKNELTVTDEETTRAVVEHIRQYPGREQQLWDMFRNNPEALAERARAGAGEQGGGFPGRARQGHRKTGVARGALSSDDDDKAVA